MHELTHIINSIFFGFSVLNIILVTGRFFSRDSGLGKKILDLADKMIIWNGAALLLIILGVQLFLLALILESNNNVVGGLKVAGVNHSMPKYFLLACLIASSQLFRFNRIKKNSLLRLLIAFLILIVVKLEEYVIIVTSLNRDYTPSGHSFFWNFFCKWGIELSVFGGVFFLVYLISSFRNKNE